MVHFLYGRTRLDSVSSDVVTYAGIRKKSLYHDDLLREVIFLRVLNLRKSSFNINF